MTAAPVFLPGSTIGVMGGGQLGRMLGLAARRMGYQLHSFSPERDTPAGQVADLEVCAQYSDEEAVRAFAKGIDVLTFEFENVPVESIEWAAQHCVVRPAGRVLEVCQHRLREKTFLKAAGLPLPEFVPVESLAQLETAVAQLGTPAVLKTAAFGYDGKGQRKILKESDLAEVWSSFAGQAAVLEAWVPFERELSVLVARGTDGSTVTYPVCENVHANHILDLTLVPARITETAAKAASAIAVKAAHALELTGLLAVELFLLPDGTILVNELAPRPHNSGHFSLDASMTNQFEQQLRAVCGLPLGSTELLRPCAMANLLGDAWEGGEPDWAAALGLPSVKLHLYGKKEARPGRKMGHLVAMGATLEEAEALVRDAQARLTRRGA
jgi:5-(carboxyamino)imidazole ribonucleotide synthase